MSLRILWMRGVWHGDELRFKRPRVFQLGDQEVEVAHRVQPSLVDLSGDGFLDVVALDPWNMVTAYFGDGTETFSRAERLLDVAGNPIEIHPQYRASNSGRSGIAMADWTGDGRIDLFVFRRGREDGCRLYRNAGLPDEHRFESEYALLYNGSFTRHNGGITLFDWNADGCLDLVTGGGPPALFRVFSGDSVSVPFQAGGDLSLGQAE